MKKSLDRIAHYVAYAYIIIPFILFFIGWLSPVYACITTGIVLVSAVALIKDTKEFIGIDLSGKKLKIFLILFILTVVVFFSGIGSYTFQNEDHQVRSAVMNDLVNKKWPLMLNNDHKLSPNQGPVTFIYYFIYWLPAAFAGKIFGIKAGYFCLFLWTLLGMTLTFYFVSRHLKKASVWLLLIFLTFDGLYLHFSFLKMPVFKAISSDYVTWANDMRLADNIIDGLYWIYNQTVTPWLIAAMLLNKPATRNILFLYALCYFHGPFMFIGLFPYVIVILSRQIKAEHLNSVAQVLRSYFTFQNVAGGLTVVLIGFFFLSASPAAEPLRLTHRYWKMYLMFIFAVFGLISLLIYSKYKKEPFFYITIAICLILPFTRLGSIQVNTFSTRVALAAQFMLAILVARYIFEEKKRMRIAVIAYCCICSLAAVGDVARSVIFTVGYWTNREATNKVLYDRSTIWGPRKAMFPQYTSSQNFLLQNDLQTLDTTYFGNGPKSIEAQKMDKFFIKYLQKK